MTGTADEAEGPLFLRAFGVPFWALARVFGKGAMYWYRLEVGLGRNSVAGATVRRADLPEHLLADEHHQTRDGDKNYIAATVGEGCCLGAALAPTANADDLTDAYAVFRREAQDIRLGYRPRTVGIDGWAATRQAWLVLYPPVALLPARLAQHPQPGQVGLDVRGAVGEGVGGVPRPGPEVLRAATAAPAGEGAAPRRGVVGVGTGAQAVRAVAGVRLGLRAPRRAPDEQHAGPGHAGDEPVFRGWPTPARLAGGVRAACPSLGVVAELPALGPGGGTG